MLQAHVPLDVHGDRSQTEMILDMLLKASAEPSSLEAVSADLEGSADSNTIRKYLNQVLEAETKNLRQQEQL